MCDYSLLPALLRHAFDVGDIGSDSLSIKRPKQIKWFTRVQIMQRTLRVVDLTLNKDMQGD